MQDRQNRCHAVQGNVYMLSSTAVEFLTSIFRRRCTASNVFPIDLLLQDTGPASLFHNAPPATTPDDHPLGWASIRQLLVRSSDPRYLPLESFLSIWAYCTMVNPRKSVMAMVYLGYPGGYGRCGLTSTAAIVFNMFNQWLLQSGLADSQTVRAPLSG